MTKSKKDQLLAFYATTEGLHKINTVRTGLTNKTIESFPQIFATVRKSNLQTLLGSEFYAFEKKVADPGRFTLNEIELMSSFFKIEFDIMLRFVRKTMIVEQKRNRRKK